MAEGFKNQTKHRANVLTKLNFQQRITVLTKLKPFAQPRDMSLIICIYAAIRAPGYKEAYRASLILSLGLWIEGGLWFL